VIVVLHVATGAAACAASGSRLAALPLSPILHPAGDWLPHQAIRSRRFEIGSGLGASSSSACAAAARSGDARRRGEFRTRSRAGPPVPAPARSPQALPRPPRLAPHRALPSRPLQLLLAGANYRRARRARESSLRERAGRRIAPSGSRPRGNRLRTTGERGANGASVRRVALRIDLSSAGS
jgi:hypothetical protein